MRSRLRNKLGFCIYVPIVCTYIRRVFSYQERERERLILPKHAVLSCTICSNMSVTVGTLVWTGRSVLSSPMRWREYVVSFLSPVRSRSDEIHGVNSPSHSLSLSFFLSSLASFHSSFFFHRYLVPSNNPLSLSLSYPFLSDAFVYICMCCMYVLWTGPR